MNNWAQTTKPRINFLILNAFVFQAEASEGAGGYTSAFEEAAIGGMNHLSISDRTGISGIEDFINLPECMSNFMKFVNLFCDYQKRDTYQGITFPASVASTLRRGFWFSYVLW